MSGRRDALVAGAEVAGAVERAAVESGGSDTVATVGVFDVYPRAVNSIPSRVFMTVDVRDVDLERRDRVVSKIEEAVAAISKKRGVEAQVDVVNADPPATCDAGVVEATEVAAEEGGLETLQMVSRAYHDTLFMTRVCPVGMVFIPCKNGVSHRPDEYSAPEAIEKGVRVLARTLARLAG